MDKVTRKMMEAAHITAGFTCLAKMTGKLIIAASGTEKPAAHTAEGQHGRHEQRRDQSRDKTFRRLGRRRRSYSVYHVTVNLCTCDFMKFGEA